MELLLESTHVEDYLGELPPIVVFTTPLVKAKIQAIKAAASSQEERARLAFLVARDEVHHSFDTGNSIVTINAEDALARHEGICFAKSHVLATLLRGMGIPTGFCYQRVVRKGTVESGHALHGLNALYLPGTGWFRVDPRGNKPGIDSRFSTMEERLAYPIREALGEVDYPNVFTAPLPAVIASMLASKSSFELFHKRPQAL